MERWKGGKEEKDSLAIAFNLNLSPNKQYWWLPKDSIIIKNILMEIEQKELEKNYIF